MRSKANKDSIAPKLGTNAPSLGANERITLVTSALLGHTRAALVEAE